MGKETVPGDTSPAESSKPAVSRQPAVSRVFRVLIVEDEIPVRTALKRYFERKGWRAEAIGDADAALALLRDAPDGAFHVILTDMAMAGIGGAGLHDALRDSRPEFFRRLIITSGNLSSPEASALHARSTRPFVSKPFDFSSLMAIVSAVARGER